MSTEPAVAPSAAAPPPRLFAVHALAAFAGLVFLNWLVVTYAPFAIKQIGDSYLIMYYHVPSAIAMLALYLVVCVAGIAYLGTRSPAWDRVGRAYAWAGLLANAVALATGSVWAKAAWNVWWDWRDPKLTPVAVAFLLYLGYAAIHSTVEDEDKRPRYAAVFGILAALNVPMVVLAPKLFGPGSHPPNVGTPDPRISGTWGFGVLAFLVFYWLLARWKLHRDTVRERVEAALARVRRIEEASA